MKVIYTNSGSAVLALAENAVHKLFKWQKSERNLSGKVKSISVVIEHLLVALKIISSYMVFACLGKQQCPTTALAAI